MNFYKPEFETLDEWLSTEHHERHCAAYSWGQRCCLEPGTVARAKLEDVFNTGRARRHGLRTVAAVVIGYAVASAEYTHSSWWLLVVIAAIVVPPTVHAARRR